MKIKVRPDESVTEPSDAVVEFLESLSLDPVRWDEEQEIEFPQGGSFTIYGMDVSPRSEVSDCQWIWRVEKQEGCEMFWLGSRPIAAEIARARSVCIGDLVSTLPEEVTCISFSNLVLVGLPDSLKRRSNLTNLNFSDCLYLRRISLSSFSNLTSLNLLGCLDLESVCVDGLKQLRKISLKSCNSLIEINGLSGLVSLNSITFDLSSNLEAADIVSNFDRLHNLENVSLSGNGCWGLSDVSFFSNLKKLKHLELNDCWSLSEASQFSKLKKLRTLRLVDFKSLADFSWLSDLTNLNKLHLENCLIGKSWGGLYEISSLIKLKELSLCNFNRLIDIDDISAFSNLRSLNLSGCSSIADIAPLAGLKSLRTLNLSGCESVTGIASLAELKSLRILNLSGCKLLSDVSVLSEFEELNHLDLSNCRKIMNFSCIRKLTKLVGLSLERTGFGAADSLVLSNLVALANLNLSNCPGLDNLHSLLNIINISDLNLAGNRRIDNFSPLSQFKKLARLNLNECENLQTVDPLSTLRALRSFSFTSRRVQSIEVLREMSELQDLQDFNPPEVCEALAHAAVLRADRFYIFKHARRYRKGWLDELIGWETGAIALRERFAATLGEAFSLLGENEIEIPYEEYLQGHPEYSSAPWKAWLAGTRSESGLALMRRRIERQAIPASTPGCIGGICTVLAAESEALEEVEWSKAWLNQMEEHWKECSKDLLSVSAEICLAYARLGESEALARWLKRFTDPSDLGVLDPVQVALATFQMTRGDLGAAQAHIFAVQSAQMRDPLLLRLVEVIGVNDPLQSSLFLLLIEDAAARAQLAIRMVLKKEFASNETVLHRLIVSLDVNPSALAELISNLPTETSNPVIQKISEGLKIDRKALYQKLAAELGILVDWCLSKADEAK